VSRYIQYEAFHETDSKFTAISGNLNELSVFLLI